MYQSHAAMSDYYGGSQTVKLRGMALRHVLSHRNDVWDSNDSMYEAFRTSCAKDGLLCLASPISFHGSVVDVRVTS